MASVRALSRPTRGLPLSQISRKTSASSRRWASSQAAAQVPLEDLEDSALDAPPLSEEEKRTFRPWKRQADRKFALPSGRYNYHAPKYDRGPLHPVQPLSSSEPTARDFVPGPFNLPRLRQTYLSTVASDIMTLTYSHVPPGTPKKETPQRLREWDDSSPYHKNRSLRAPRGAPVLPLIERDINFTNIPEIKEITLAAYSPAALQDMDNLLVARAALLAITGVLPEMTKTKSNVQQWKIRAGEFAGCKVTVRGNEAYEFLDRCVNLVFPKIKDWRGIKASTGDSSGNLAWGFTPEELKLFPEMEVNMGMYPPKMVPGCRVYVKTTATSDRQARLLLQSMGLPFYGEVKN
ncbi:putative mitochondrial LSU ribosomal protein L7 precursor [Triangularia verruculosa]|uniref:Mitochondrial LSU ribosomal protein L7 n=1 Tax=Triangularia verruculosa TaxID=2587418 RepID=A0AAN6XV41_9PEZI|nr:putative mitochondrial LSU ribosomal protein L7 precursor [Triangularia verruculosa]